MNSFLDNSRRRRHVEYLPYPDGNFLEESLQYCQSNKKLKTKFLSLFLKYYLKQTENVH